MLHITLYQPDIAPNTGNIGRTCAITGSRLHLIHPLGFKISDRHLRRAGMDYWKTLDVHEHADFDRYLSSPAAPPRERTWVFSTHAGHSLWDVGFDANDGLLFGKETAGLPEDVHAWAGDRCVRVPMFDTTLRSLNLATCVGVCVYEALRQIHRA